MSLCRFDDHGKMEYLHVKCKLPNTYKPRQGEEHEVVREILLMLVDYSLCILVLGETTEEQKSFKNFIKLSHDFTRHVCWNTVHFYIKYLLGMYLDIKNTNLNRYIRTLETILLQARFI